MSLLFKHVFEKQVIHGRLNLIKPFSSSDLMSQMMKRNSAVDPGNNLLLYRLPKIEFREIASKSEPLRPLTCDII